jgi:general nucleoside transport system permease protein
MIAILEQIFQVGFLAAIIRIATPLTLATLGEMISERSGVLNLGIEGIMLISAMTGFMGAYYSGNLWIGILVAAVTGAAFAALHATLTVVLGVSQHVCGIGVTLLCTGLAYFFFRLSFTDSSHPATVQSFKTVPIPVLSDIPLVGPALFNQFALTYHAALLIPLISFLLYRTPWGLNVRMVGENPRAADAAGVSVMATRFWAVTLGGVLMGVAGAFLTMAQFNTFTFGVISGRGWIAIALVVFGRWDPWRCAGAAVLFALVDALQLRLQTVAGMSQAPYEVFLALPFLFTIVAMAVMSRDAAAPPALLQPFRKEER